MEEKLEEIQDKFKSGKCKESISDLEQLINDYPNDIYIFQVHDRLGDYLNYLGEHSQAVQSYEKCLETIEDDDDEISTWINVSLQIARILFQQGKDGPGVSHKSNRVTIIPSKMSEDEKKEWIDDHLNKSIKYFRQALTKIPEHLAEIKLKIQTELASVLLYVKNFDEAIEIYENGFHNYGQVEWLYKAAHCLWEEGKKDLAYSRLEQLIDADPKFAKAYKMLETYFEEKNETEKALEAKQKYQFYSWIPKFCQNIDFNEENLSILENMNSKTALECVRTTLTNDLSRRSTEFLASICYHHYHGILDDTAFEQLEIRGVNFNDNDEKDFIRGVLMYLLEHCTSNCTIRGAASALAAIKHEKLFEILAKLIYRDINYFHPMDIPLSLGKLQDPRAIPVLINLIENPIKYQSNDLDSSDDEIFSSIGVSRLVQQSCFALGSFINDERVKSALINGIKNERVHEPCLAVLYISTLEDQYLKQLKQILEGGDTLDYRVIVYLYEHQSKSEDIEKILSLNKEIYDKKKKNKK